MPLDQNMIKDKIYNNPSSKASNIIETKTLRCYTIYDSMVGELYHQLGNHCVMNIFNEIAPEIEE